MIQCSTCAGEGEYVDPHLGHPVECPECFGSGEIPERCQSCGAFDGDLDECNCWEFSEKAG